VANSAIGIGLIGLGTVGQGVVKLLQEQAAEYTRRVGRPVELRKVLVRNASAKRTVKLAKSLITQDADAFFATPGIDIVVEVAGGLKPVGDYVKRALEAGKHVVTANKSLLAHRGGELFDLARRKGVSIAFEASCGGGIPILGALKFGLGANRIDALYGILNGTCNFILTKMSDNAEAYSTALAEAQRLGFAEADPTLDVSGADAAQKLCIVAALAFGVSVDCAKVAHEGIDKLQIEDINFGRELGYTIRLLAIGERINGGLSLRVQPCFVQNTQPLAQVRSSFNALSVFGHAVGHVMFYGRGAGQTPTASAVVSDILNVAGGWYPRAFESMNIWPDQHEKARLVDSDEVTARYYLRINVKDQPGVMAQLTKVLGDNGISISAVLQHEPGAQMTGHVPVVVTTYKASEGDIRKARRQLAKLKVVRDDPVCIRIIDFPQG
jgi:homoserine dehydrogenase